MKQPTEEQLDLAKKITLYSIQYAIHDPITLLLSIIMLVILIFSTIVIIITSTTIGIIIKILSLINTKSQNKFKNEIISLFNKYKTLK